MRRALLVCALLGLAAPAFAQDADNAGDAPAPKKRAKKTGVGKKNVGGKNVYVIDDEFVVEGRVARPSAVILLSRARVAPAPPPGAPGWIAAIVDAWQAEDLARTRLMQRRRALATAEGQWKAGGQTPPATWARERVQLEALLLRRDEAAGKLRDQAIARVEAYLAGGAAGVDAAFARDVLGHLYLQRADDQWQAVVEGFEAALAADPLAAEPPAAPDHAQSIATWWQVLVQQPSYPGRDGLLYMLAQAAADMPTAAAVWPGGSPFGQVDPERYLFGALACPAQFPLPPPPAPAPPASYATCAPAGGPAAGGASAALRADAWYRLGEYHFEQPGELPLAASAYEQALALGGPASLRAPTIYKLAWTLYRLDRMEEALRRFDQLLALPAGDGADLRAEALQYAAITLTESWDATQTTVDPGEALTRAEAFYRGRDREPQVHDVWAQLGSVLGDLGRYPEAARALQTAVGRWPLHADNPTVHQHLIGALQSGGDYAGVARERAAVVDRYGPGSAWEKANAGHPDALRARDRVVEEALYGAALQLHSEAQRSRQQQQSSLSPPRAGADKDAGGYLQAAELYRRYLQLYPTGSNAARVAYLRGEALYWGG
ncbi:MAG TPA: hypothetical protein VL172_06470, partial [Kofleriaceae bacterium]|nr:hypothetical protein [Kofleriaceae bacterium]